MFSTVGTGAEWFYSGPYIVDVTALLLVVDYYGGLCTHRSQTSFNSSLILIHIQIKNN